MRGSELSQPGYYWFWDDNFAARILHAHEENHGWEMMYAHGPCKAGFIVTGMRGGDSFTVNATELEGVFYGPLNAPPFSVEDGK